MHQLACTRACKIAADQTSIYVRNLVNQVILLAPLHTALDKLGMYLRIIEIIHHSPIYHVRYVSWYFTRLYSKHLIIQIIYMVQRLSKSVHQMALCTSNIRERTLSPLDITFLQKLLYDIGMLHTVM